MSTPAFFYSNVAVQGVTGAAITAAATSVYLSTTPSGYPTTFPFRLVLGGAEIVSVTAGSGTSGTPWTITRAQDGTTAAAWGSGTSVQHMLTAGDLALSRSHEIAAQAQLPHGLPSGAWLAGGFSTINETTLPSSTTNLVTWSGIPATYKHLLVLIQGRLTRTDLQADDVTCQVNGDASAVYSYNTISATNISGAGTGALTQSQFTTSAVTNWPLIRIAASLAGTAVNAGGGFAFLPNYSQASYNKSFYAFSGAGNGSAAMTDSRLRCGFYNPATQAAISSLSLACASGFFVSGTFVGLYAFG